METNDIDFDAFRNSFDKERDFKFNERDWHRLEHRLDAGKSPNIWQIRMRWALVASCIGILISSNGYLIWRLNSSAQSITNLHSEVAQLKDQIANVHLSKFQVEQGGNSVSKVGPNEAVQKPQSTKIRNVEGSGSEFKEATIVFSQKVQKSDQELAAFVDELQVHTSTFRDGGFGNKPTLTELITSNRQSVNYNHHFIPGLNLAKLKINNKKDNMLFDNLRKIMTPKMVVVGVNFGKLFPISKDLNEKKGVSIGLSAEFALSGHIRVIGDLSYERLHYSTNTMNTELGVPIIDSPAEFFEFGKAKVPQNNMLATVGLKYLLTKNTKWQPFIAAGYGIAVSLPHQIQYEFEDQSGTEVQVTKESDKVFNSNGTINAGVGVAYNLADNIGIQLDAIHNWQLNNPDLSSPSVNKLRASFLYYF